MGAVYLARDRRLDRPVALKVIRPELLDSTAVRERFVAEARATAQLNHPSIVTLHDVGEHRGLPYLVLEYLEGPTLRDRLQHGPLDSAEAASIGAAIAGALEHAHSRGLLHLDLKPANVLLAADGVPRVLDFGLARGFGVGGRRESPRDAEAPTRAPAASGSQPIGAWGTPHYMAPELWRGEAAGGATDVWALGVLLYEALAGRRPFDGSELAAVIWAICQEEPPPLPPGVSAWLAELVTGCLSREPAARPSAAACAERLRAGGEAACSSRRLGAPVLAVLPFSLRGAGDATLCEILSEEIVDVLSRLRGWRVLSAAATAGLSSPLEAARSLGADAMVSGTVQQLGAALRITVRLHDARTQAQTYSERFEEPLDRFLALQDRFCRRVAEKLRSELASTVLAADVPAEAMDLYLRGRHKARCDDLEGSEGAVAMLERCLSAAPDFAAARASHALATLRAWWLPNDRGSDAWEHDARRSVALALRDAAELPETQLAAAQLRVFDAEYPGAVEALARALELAPTCAPAHQYLAMLECEAARPDDGARRARLAAELDPTLFTCLLDLCRFHALRQDWRSAEEALGEATARAPRFHLAPQVTRIRLASWRGDGDTIATTWAAIQRQASSSRALASIRRYVDVLYGHATPEQLLEGLAAEPAARLQTRFRSFHLQCVIDACCAVGGDEVAAHILGELARGCLIDLEWLDRCPLLASLRRRPDFAPAREAVAARAAAMWVIAPPATDLLR